MNIERNTLVVFLSDNGPEHDAGTTGWPWTASSGHRGNKRYLYEGGIRVPCIWQWIGMIPKGKSSNALGISTDIYPTFLEVAGVSVPSTVRLDGMSLLPVLLGHYKGRKKAKKAIAERMGLWHTAYEGPRASAAILFDYKVISKIFNIIL